MNPQIFESSTIGLPRSVIAVLESFLIPERPAVDFFGNPCVPLGLDTKDGAPQIFKWTPNLISLVNRHTKGTCLPDLKLAPADAVVPQAIRLHRCQVGSEIPIPLVSSLTDNLVSLPLAVSLLTSISPRFMGVSVPLDSRFTCFLPIMLEGTLRLFKVEFVPSSSDLRWYVRFTNFSKIPKGSNLILTSAISVDGHPFIDPVAESSPVAE